MQPDGAAPSPTANEAAEGQAPGRPDPRWPLAHSCFLSGRKGDCKELSPRAAGNGQEENQNSSQALLVLGSVRTLGSSSHSLWQVNGQSRARKRLSTPAKLRVLQYRPAVQLLNGIQRKPRRVRSCLPCIQE